MNLKKETTTTNRNSNAVDMPTKNEIVMGKCEK